jgi:hypothetical protein
MLMRRERARMSGAASAVLGGTFLIAAMAHATDGFTDRVADAHMTPSVVLGIVSGIALLIAAFGLLSEQYWGWRVGFGAHLLAIVSVLLAFFSVAAGYGHAASLAIPGGLLVLLLLSMVALWRARPRNPAQRMKHEIAAKMY